MYRIVPNVATRVVAMDPLTMAASAVSLRLSPDMQRVQSPLQHHNQKLEKQMRGFSTSTACSQAMKPGTPIPGLGFYKDRDAPVALERSEYPEWVDKLATPMKTLGQLRRTHFEDATMQEKHRYFKLKRRLVIKKWNSEHVK